MSWKNNKTVLPRCLKCRMHLGWCLCEMMPHFDLKTRIVLVMQWGEHGVISNTGHLIPKIFKNSEIRFRGHHSRQPLDLHDIGGHGGDPHVLFPLGGARVLDEGFVNSRNKPITLVVLDGNWHQTAKMAKRIPGLVSLPKLALPQGPPSSYRLRFSPREDGVCTFEAIARALGFLEGREIQAELEGFFTILIERMLYTRSKIRASEVTGGVPSPMVKMNKN